MEQSSEQPIFGYWSVRGLGAQIRYILAYSGVKVKEELYA